MIRRLCAVIGIATTIACASSSGTGSRDVLYRTERYNWSDPCWKTSFGLTTVEQHVTDYVHGRGAYRQRFRATREQIAAVEAALDQTDFENLPESITLPANPDGTMTIVSDDPESCITARGHRVCGEEYPLTHTPHGARFLRVWRALTDIAPEP